MKILQTPPFPKLKSEFCPSAYFGGYFFVFPEANKWDIFFMNLKMKR